MKMLEELEVSFFLPGNEVVDEHGALRGDGLVDGCTTGFAYDKMVLI